MLTYSGPPPVSAVRLLTLWSFDPLVDVALAVALLAYLAGLRRLVRRGDRWPINRTLAWVLGLFLVLYAVSGGLGAYDDTLFSVHMAQHMMLGILAPIPLALGAPITLALRTLPPRPRRWLLVALHSRVARVLTFPPFGFVLFVGSLVTLIFSGLYGYSLTHPWFHELTHVHFLVVGCIFLWPLVGVDPMPHRAPHWARLLVVFAALPFHAFVGLALMSTTHVIAPTYYFALGRPWGNSPLNDQQTGGAVMWGAGDIIALALLAAVVTQWMRADERAAVRADRKADREDSSLEAAEAAWNARLAALGRLPRA